MPRTKTYDRDVLLRQAMELFWQKGYHATSMQDLVDHLGIGRAAIYSSFNNKRDLFEEAFALYRKESAEETTGFLARHGSVREGLKALFRQAIQHTIEDPNRKGCFVVNVTTEMVPGDDPLLPVLKETQAQTEAMFHGYLLQGEASGEIPPGKDLKAIATMIFIYYNGIKVLAKTQDKGDKLTQTVELVVSLLD